MHPTTRLSSESGLSPNTSRISSLVRETTSPEAISCQRYHSDCVRPQMARIKRAGFMGTVIVVGSIESEASSLLTRLMKPISSGSYLPPSSVLLHHAHRIRYCTQSWAFALIAFRA